MIVEVKIPLLPESVPDATLLDWNRQAGEAVTKDEILIELETDKVVLEVPAPESGVLVELVKNAGETALSQEVIARIDTEAKASVTSAEAPATDAATEAPAAAPKAAAPEPAEKPAAPAAAGAAPLLGPAAAKLAADKGLDPSTLKGTGPGGRVTKADVLGAVVGAPKAEPTAPAAAKQAPAKSAAAQAPGAERAERRVAMTRLRQRIAERLVQAQQTAAILTTFNEVNMQPVMELRKRLRDDFEKVHGVRLGFMSFFAKAAVQALKEFPAVNAYIEGTDIVYHDYYDIGVAVGSPRGLLVPVVRDVDRLSFAGIESAISDFGRRAQDGTIGIEELSGGTFTISNGGVFGSMLSTPILNPPQSGILGMHKTQERPVAENGQVVVRPVMYLALSYDHRIIDGREAVQFLVTIKDCIEDPGRMLLEV